MISAPIPSASKCGCRVLIGCKETCQFLQCFGEGDLLQRKKHPSALGRSSFSRHEPGLAYRFQCEISFCPPKNLTTFHQSQSYQMKKGCSMPSRHHLGNVNGTGLACWRKHLWEPLLFVNGIGPSGHTLGLAGYLDLIGSLGLVVKCIVAPRFWMLEDLKGAVEQNLAKSSKNAWNDGAKKACRTLHSMFLLSMFILSNSSNNNIINNNIPPTAS